MGAAKIKALRERTGAGMLDCKKALEENEGDVDKAIDWLRAKGITRAAKKAGRAATEGLVVSYIHAGGKIGVLLEVNCETDFVAMNEQFQTLCNDIAMHIAAAAPEYVDASDVPADAIEREKQIQKERVIEEGKPEHIAEKIVEGRMGKFYEEVCLLDQKFVKDDGKTVRDIVTDAVATIGENIKVRRFSRYVLGEGLEKKQSDLAAEVAAQLGQWIMDEYLESMDEDMKGALAALEAELAKIRTGRATPKLLDGVQVLVQSYGASMPLNQLASVQVPDARLLVVQPWDKSTITDIERAIVQAGLGLNPSNDGQVVRVPVPALTQDRRQQLVKLVKKAGEDTKVRVRHVRREYNDIIKTAEKDGDVSEDDARRLEKQVQETTDAYVTRIDERVAEKEEEVLEV